MHPFPSTLLAWRCLLWRPFHRILNRRLGRAVLLGDILLVAKLLDLGAHPNAHLIEGFTPLTLNHTKSDVQCAELACLLLSRGAHPDMAHTSGMRPLHYAAIFSLPILCRTLVDGGANVQALDSGGLTPSARAHLAEKHCFPELVLSDTSPLPKLRERVQAELLRGEMDLHARSVPAGQKSVRL